VVPRAGAVATSSWIRSVIVLTMSVSLMGACSWNPRPVSRAAARPVVDLNPFDAAPHSFVVAAPRFAPGETAIVRICVSTEGVISSANVIGSSGDRRFDEFALIWARQVRLASRPQNDNAKELCGAVRVEVRGVPFPDALSGADNALG
jgi:TonB family protein